MDDYGSGPAQQLFSADWVESCVPQVDAHRTWAGLLHRARKGWARSSHLLVCIGWSHSQGLLLIWPETS